MKSIKDIKPEAELLWWKEGQDATKVEVIEIVHNSRTMVTVQDIDHGATWDETQQKHVPLVVATPNEWAGKGAKTVSWHTKINKCFGEQFTSHINDLYSADWTPPVQVESTNSTMEL